jgi:hypothetical protein
MLDHLTGGCDQDRCKKYGTNGHPHVSLQKFAQKMKEKIGRFEGYQVILMNDDNVCSPNEGVDKEETGKPGRCDGDGRKAQIDRSVVNFAKHAVEKFVFRCVECTRQRLGCTYDHTPGIMTF